MSTWKRVDLSLFIYLLWHWCGHWRFTCVHSYSLRCHFHLTK